MEGKAGRRLGMHPDRGGMTPFDMLTIGVLGSYVYVVEKLLDMG